uniref:Uncharacterized protein n=1 Tax=Romanomermis culicivorax TaxID=13658 RepID=A0A915JQQ9_ROMCU
MIESCLPIANTYCQRTEWIASPFLARKSKVPRDLPPVSSNPLRNRTSVGKGKKMTSSGTRLRDDLPDEKSKNRLFSDARCRRSMPDEV